MVKSLISLHCLRRFPLFTQTKMAKLIILKYLHMYNYTKSGDFSNKKPYEFNRVTTGHLRTRENGTGVNRNYRQAEHTVL